MAQQRPGKRALRSKRRSCFSGDGLLRTWYSHLEPTWRYWSPGSGVTRGKRCLKFICNFLRGTGNIFFKKCIAFPLCSREHASSILEFVAASALVARRTFSLREGLRVHDVARSPTSVCVPDAAIIRPESGFLKSILQDDFVCFKYLLGTLVYGNYRYAGGLTVMFCNLLLHENIPI
jgi:hypothetical protein